VRLLANVFRVGEGVFPGQSVPAAALSGLRVARLALAGNVSWRTPLWPEEHTYW